jgi:hypothetical protein
MKRLSHRIVWATVLISIVFTGSALADGEAPPWTYVEVGYSNVDVDALDDKGDGWFAGGSFGGKRWHVFGNYAQSETDDLAVDVDKWYAGAGWHGLLGEKADLFADVAYVDATIGPVDDTGYFGRLGVRWRLIKLLELGANTRFEDLGDLDDDLVWEANAILYFWRLGIGVNYEIQDDIDTFNGYVRFVF